MMFMGFEIDTETCEGLVMVVCKDEEIAFDTIDDAKNFIMEVMAK